MEFFKQNKIDFSKLKSGISDTEIFGLLDKHLRDKIQITIWQKGKNTKKHYKVMMNGLSLDKRTMLFSLPGLNEKLSQVLEEGKSIYFYSKLKNIVFKSDIFTIVNNKLIVVFPKSESFLLDDKRASERYYLSDINKKEIVLDVEEGLHGSEKFRTFTYRILDISESGIALEIKPHHLGKLTLGKNILIKQIKDLLFNGLHCEVVHLTKIDEAKNLYKAGIVFREHLENELIQDIAA